MPWFPEFAIAAELARRDSHAAGLTDPVGRYLDALRGRDERVLERIWPGEVVIHDPRAGEVRGHRELRHFVRRSHAWLEGRSARIDTVAATVARGRAVVELLAHLDGDGAAEAWPVAVVAELHGPAKVTFRIYCSQKPVDGRHHVRPPILEHRPIVFAEAVTRYLRALAIGEVEAILRTFATDGYFREPVGPHADHRGDAELATFFARQFSAGGGIDLQPCAITDDGERCAVEYNCVRWGDHELPPQAGITVYERGSDGLLAGARAYHDIEAPHVGASAG